MKDIHEATVEVVDELRTVIKCQCGYVAVATVEHLDGDELDGGRLVPFRIDIINPGERVREPLRFKDGRPFLDQNGDQVYRTVGPRHPVLLGSPTDKPGNCRLA
jgi:hypothetical protein